MPTPPDRIKAYDLDARVVEIYDQTETQTEDLALLRLLLQGRQARRILEPFCGNGRLLIPLAEDGHTLTGIDRSLPMLDSAREKIRRLPPETQRRITLLQADLPAQPLPGGFEVVILGGNCLYELGTPQEQEACIAAARHALEPGGWLYLDNNHMEGELDPAWRDTGIHEQRFPTGVCADGTRLQAATQTVWYDAAKRLVRIRRTLEIISPDGSRQRREWVEQKHPPSTAEMQAWLEQHGFVILERWGDRQRAPYRDDSPRAVFWAQRLR